MDGLPRARTRTHARALILFRFQKQSAAGLAPISALCTVLYTMLACKRAGFGLHELGTPM